MTAAPESKDVAGETISTAAPAAGRPPVAVPVAAYLGAFVAVLVLALGVVALRDTAVFAGWVHGGPWLAPAIGWFDGLQPAAWMVLTGVAAAAIGVWWAIAAILPRRRTAVALTARTSVWLTQSGLARITTTAAESVPGVVEARSSAGLRKVKVSARVTTDDEGAIRGAISEAVTRALACVTDTPRVVVRIRRSDRS